MFYLLLFCDKNCELMHMETRESPETTPHYTQSYAYTNMKAWVIVNLPRSSKEYSYGKVD